MKSAFKRLMAWGLCFVMVAALLPLPSFAVSIADTVEQNHYGNYETLAMIYNQGDCYSMQGMTLDSS